HGRRQDVDVLVGEHPGDVGQQAGAVQRFDLQRDKEHRVPRGLPFHLDETVGVEVFDVPAVVAVDGDPGPAGNESDDGVPGHGGTALGQAHPHVRIALDDHSRVACGPFPRHPDRGGGFRDVLFVVVERAHGFDELLDDFVGADLVFADGRIQRVQVAVAQVVGECDQRLAGEQPLNRQLLLAHDLGDRLFALLDRCFAALLGEPLPDLVAGSSAFHEVQPVAARAGVVGLGRDDLHGLPVVQLAVEGNQTAVDAGPHRAVADLGVHRVGEVDGGGALRQGDDVPAGGEDEDFLHRQVEAERLQELAGVLRLLLPVDELPQPGHVGGSALGFAAVVALLLVLPVRGDAVFCAPVHGAGADLQFHRAAFRADHGGVQGLVHVELRHRDVVFEPPRHRIPAGVNDAERRVAVADAVHNDADTDQVVDLVEPDIAGDHLLVDRVVVLGPAAHGGFDFGFPQVGGDDLNDLLQVDVAPGGAFRDQAGDLVEAFGVQGGEREVLQLPLDGVHAQAVGQRRVDFQGLPCFLLPLGLRQVAQGAHVVQAVAEFDDQDADVAGHRYDHLADGLGLGGLAVLHLVELGDPVDKFGDLIPEVAAQLVEGVLGVLDRVVQQPRGDGGLLHAEFRDRK